MINLREEAYEKAIAVLDKCVRKQGFYASGLKGGYEATWSRDSMITAIGASLCGTRYKSAFLHSLNTLGKWQTPKGQIPNCVGSYNLERRSDKTYNSIDSSLWYIIGHYIYAEAYDDESLIERHKKSIARALIWLKYQDPNEDKLLTQLPTMDCQDAFPHKYGRVLNTQALYHMVLKMVGNSKEAKALKRNVNGDTFGYLNIWSKKLGYYYPWIWKDHDGDLEHNEWFDSLGNTLAILFGLATVKQAKSIVKHIEKDKISSPVPLKAIWPPIKPGDKAWRSYFSKCDAKDPLHYLNGGIWPFIGGFYVGALVKMRDYKRAEAELDKLAQGVMSACKIRKLKGEYEFNEWLHGKSGEPMGEPYQGWTAGMYIYAYECVKRRNTIYF